MSTRSVAVFARVIAGVLVLGGCSSAYYGAMEKIGIDKREIMVDRVEAARDSQAAAKEQFLTALEKFKQVVAFEGGDLERRYEELNAALQKSEARADAVHERIRAVEDVSDALFDEWRAELKQYANADLRRRSQQKYDVAKQRYSELLIAMKRAESRLEPALVPLRDQVLFMKHNLNAKAIAGLDDELVRVEADVDRLVRDMDAAIAKAETFIATLRDD